MFKWNGLSSPEFVGMDNFQRIFTKDIYFTDSIKATILYALLAVVGAIIYSLLVALLLNMKIWGRTIIPFYLLHSVPFTCNLACIRDGNGYMKATSDFLILFFECLE
ncbi:MAG: hypothetical protein ACLRIP_11205 [Blautia massiliensis (ex Durand et al. 2017)]